MASCLSFCDINDIIGVIELKPPNGFEPSTNGLQNRCSTTELQGQINPQAVPLDFPNQHQRALGVLLRL